MKANESSVEDFLSLAKTQFVIPVYQRNYDWKQAQCRQLLEDIIAVSKTDDGVHFIGSIVYVRDSIHTSIQVTKLTIIDGQQRLTTLTLIYLALYQLAKERKDESLAGEILETYLINKHQGNAKKLVLTKNNEEAFEFYLQYEKNQGMDYPHFSNIRENFKYIKKQIQYRDAQIRKGLSRLMFVEIGLLKDQDDPQRIFESLNSTGLDLSQADLIRNYILMGLGYEEQQKIYETYWTVIEEKTRSPSTNENRISDFIRDFLTLETGKIPSKNKVYTDFKAKYPSMDRLEEILAKLKWFAQYYHKLLRPEAEPDKDIRDCIKSVNDLDCEVTYPFLLRVYDDYANAVIDKTVFIEVLHLVESFIWRRFICGVPSPGLSKTFMNLYEKIDVKSYLHSIQKALLLLPVLQKFPNDEKVVSALKSKDIYHIKPQNTRYLLEKLENFQNREPVVIQDNPDITIEHIFPQNPDKIWKKTLEKTEYEQMEKYLHTLSNLTLSGNNGKLGNKAFPDKKNAPESGYKDSRLWLNKYLASIDVWNIETLEKRFTILKDRFLQIWNYPDIPLDTTAVEGEVSIFAAEDPTGKKLDYIIFLDEKKEIKTVSDLYLEIVTQLFEYQPETFFSTDLAESIALTQHIGILIQPQQINSLWYIEKGLDSKTKFKKIKHILTVFDMEEELIIKYAEGSMQKTLLK
jgi:uncharacterized protein with ParB-like and HNH nuclease domain